MVKARVRVSGVEHQTIIVARAGWSTAEPAPSSVAASTAVTAVEANPRERPHRAQDGGGHDDGQRPASVDHPPHHRQDDQRRHRERGEDEPRRTRTQPTHLRHVDVEERDREPDPERSEGTAQLNPVQRRTHRPGHFHLP